MAGHWPAIVEVKADTKAFANGLKGIGGILAGATSGFAKGLIAPLSLASRLLGVGLITGAKRAIDFGETYRTQLDNARASIVGLTTSQGEANTLMKKMTDFAIATPFDLPGVQNVATRLLAVGKGFGVTTDNVIQYTKVLGDTAAINGKGADSMLNIVTVFGKISGQGRVMTRDLNQITANFPNIHPWEVLADMTGKTQAELRKLAAKPGGLSGIVDANEFVNRLNLTMAASPGVADAMERRMATLGGTMELFKDTMGVALADGLQPFFTSLQGIMKDPAIMAGLATLIQAFSGVASTIMDALAPALPALITGFSAMLTALAPLAPVIGLIAHFYAMLFTALAPVIDQFVSGLLPLLPSLLQLFNQLAIALVPIIAQIATGLLPVLAPLLDLFSQIVLAVAPLITQLISGLAPVLPLIVDLFTQVVTALAPIAGQIISALLPVLPLLVDLFSHIAFALAPLITALVTGLAPVLPLIVDLFNQVVTAIAPIAGVLIAALLPVLPIIVNLFSQLWTALGPLITQLITGLAPVLPIIAQLLSTLVSALGPLISSIVSGLLPVLAPLGELISKNIGAVGPIFITLVGLIAQLLPPLLDLITAVQPLIPLLGELLVGAVTVLLPILKPLIGFRPRSTLGSVTRPPYDWD
jgi:tape measure domain-containing protein